MLGEPEPPLGDDHDEPDHESSPTEDFGVADAEPSTGEFASRDAGRSDENDERAFRSEFGGNALRSDWLEMRRNARRLPPETEDIVLMAHLLGAQGVKALTQEALSGHDIEAMQQALTYQMALHADLINAALDQMEANGELDLESPTDHEQPTGSEDDPPVAMPRRPMKGRRG